MSDKNQMSGVSSSQLSTQMDPICGGTSMEQFTKDGYKTLMEAIRHSNALPTGRDWNFYTTSDSFTKIMNFEGNNVLKSMTQIMFSNEIESNMKNRILDEQIELIVDANDIILEKVANNIDEMLGIRKSAPEPVELQTVTAQLLINGSWNRAEISTGSSVASINASKSPSIKLITAKNIVRPQNFFVDKIDNSYQYPWQPRIQDKPNSLKPLAVFLEEFEDRQEYSHPYEYELDRFEVPAENLGEETPILPKPLSETPLIEIDTPEKLDDLVNTLRNCTEFSVDLEHHSYRTFMGITCLMQISTRDNDYLIDTLVLRDKLHILNEVFTKKSIVKIFHGSDCDIEWLQRDLSLYIVNMFDTHQAAKILEYSALSLAFLIRKFCNVVVNKQFQLADWRIRPLPQELKTYAREDTHYLIYIYQMMKNELLVKGNKSEKLVKLAFERSAEICKKRYFKPILTDDSHMDIYRKCKKMFDNRQLYALREIFAWRDQMARKEDESWGYVLPNHMLLQISEALPREMQGILACCSPIPPLVRSSLLELHHIVLKAREQPLERAILKDFTSGRGILKQITKVNVDSPLHCPHDLTKNSEFRDDLPTLLSNKNLQAVIKRSANSVIKLEKPSSIYSIFNATDENEQVENNLEKIRGVPYLSPYQRYKLVKPLAQEEERLAAEKQAAENIKKENEEINSNTNETNKEKTDDERVASIRNHFLKMSKQFSEELQAKQAEEANQKSLLEMRGSRKRKREMSMSDPDEQVQFDTPVPTPGQSLRPKKWKKGNNKRKRTFDESEQMEVPQFVAKKMKQKKNNRKNQWEQSNQSGHQPNRRNQLDQSFSPNPHQDRRNKGPKKSNKNNQEFVPYDYSSVDFRQFQGGAGSAGSGVQMKPSKFKGKGQRRMGNRGAKSATFASGSNRGRKH